MPEAIITAPENLGRRSSPSLLGGRRRIRVALKHPQSPERSELHLDLAISYPKLIGERLLIEPVGLLGRDLKNGKRPLQAVFVAEQPLGKASHLRLFRCRDIFHLIRMEICRLLALSERHPE
jgi:hypothetical protein